MMSRDYSRHIAENIAKGSSLCPFGSMTMGQMSLPEVTSSEDDQKFDLHAFDESAADSDDEPLSDLEWFGVDVPVEIVLPIEKARSTMFTLCRKFSSAFVYFNGFHALVQKNGTYCCKYLGQIIL